VAEPDDGLSPGKAASQPGDSSGLHDQIEEDVMID